MSSRRRQRQERPNVAYVYCRVSALDSQSDSDVSLQEQERQLTAAATAAGYSVIVVSERHTASKAQPELERVLDALDAGEAAALYAAKIDRLSRKGAADVLRIADRADRAGWRLSVLDVALDTGSTVGRLVLTILAGVAEMESRRRSQRMAEYHAGRRARGERSGQHYGRRNTAAADTAERILAAWIGGQSYAAIAARLDVEQTDGRRWHAQTVRRVVLAHNSSPLTLAA